MVVYLIIIFIMSSPSRYHQPQQYKYHSARTDLQVNEKELLVLRKKLLMHHYDQQISQRQQEKIGQPLAGSSGKCSQNPEFRSYDSSNSSRQINSIEIQRERKNKVELAQAYQKEISQKNDRERTLKMTRIQQEKKMLNSLQEVNRKEEEKKRLVKIMQRRQATQYYEADKMNKLREMETLSKQKEEERKKYSSNSPVRLHRNLAFCENTKLSKFKQHFDNVNKIQYQIERNYLQNWSPLLKEKDLEKERLIEAGIASVHSFQKSLKIKNEGHEIKFKAELKDSLEQQIKQKEDQRNREKSRSKLQAYDNSRHKNTHHPIINPIDFKIDHNNKPILAQLNQEREFQNSSKISGLAKNGTITLMPCYTQ